MLGPLAVLCTGPIDPACGLDLRGSGATATTSLGKIGILGSHAGWGGVDPAIAPNSGGSGAGGEFFKCGFHSQRHSFNSEVMNRGVPQELRMKLSGHPAEEMNSKCSDAELTTLRATVEKLPGLR